VQAETAFFQGRLPTLERLLGLFIEPLTNAIHHRNLREKQTHADNTLAAQLRRAIAWSSLRRRPLPEPVCLTRRKRLK
jgi:hypothetical protein